MIPLLLGALEPELGMVELALLAVLQGLTEFLPVSSSGHLVLAQAWMGLEEAPVRINVALHVGTLAAVVCAYRRDLVEITRELFAGRPREVLLVGLGTVPAVIVGFTLRSQFHEAFASTKSAGIGLLVTASLLALGERARRARGGEGRTELTWRDALVIGIAQAGAIWPGVSRSGSTIAVGMLLGLAPARAARFSFLLMIPAVLGAAVLELPDATEADGVATGELLAALAVAALVGFGAVRFLLAVLNRGTFVAFSLYCAVVGVVVLTLV